MITIVTPVYNSAVYLRACLDSILAQTYVDWQLVLVDDGSTDGSAEICDEYAADARVTVLHVPNGGAARARNIGLGAARGEWVTFIDSDDIVLPDYLADMIAAATEECDMVISGWEKDGKVTRLSPCVIDHKDFVYFFGNINYGYILGKLYRKSMLADGGVRFNPGVCWAEDAIFFCTALLFSRQAIIIGAVNYRYVAHGDSIVNRLHPYEVEMMGFEASKALVPRLYAEISPNISLSPYAFLARAITSLYATPMPRSERLARLRAVEFSPEMIRSREAGIRQRIFYHLIKGKHWRLLDYFLTR